ncbi:unnamed protein product [Rotaria socialis]|uniref:Uncharacterized protein n=1 Tax=Rotaria socialis TaxID=392032 RepID=A0A817WFX8_9BILA|nr:unnamed protein product [Rotaria socialis]CAF3355188.1 unnamed protein product [Rotaria socialis]CAF3368634.1 unnamed protein product [Rotaria socialis]CAF3385333.1 unnamed protein product [Rotaria socialis]
MASTEATPRYRNFSNNMPSSMNPKVHTSTSLIAVEKESEPNPEDQCFMCRQANVYVKPIGMSQERRVARRHPPPLSRAQIDVLSQKKNLTKLEVRKLLQCYFPEIKHVKYFQLHKFHSCCYDPKHLNLCKNHITALQHERGQNPGGHHHHHDDDNLYKDRERDGDAKDRVSFVRIKIEPTKGIPTRFLAPAALPESLAEMLLNQVNRLENKKVPPSLTKNRTILPYNVRRINMTHGSDDDDDDDDGDDDDDEEDDTEDDGDYNDNQRTQVQGKVMADSSTHFGNNRQEKLKLERKLPNGDLEVENLDELNSLYINHQRPTNFNGKPQLFSKPLRKKKRKAGTNNNGNRKSKLKHWELLALEQAKQETCNCRHHVTTVEDDHTHFDWCRCKDHQHKEVMERRKSFVATPVQPTPLPPPPPKEPVTPPAPKRRPKPRKIHTKSVGIDAAEPSSAEIALAYDPTAVDYDMIQEAIYYRTSSGRLIKPQTTNAFTYEGIPSSMMINNQDSMPNQSEVLYMTSDGKLQPFENGGRNQRNPKTIVLSKPGSLYNGQASIDAQHSSTNNAASNTLPVLKFPAIVNSTTQHANNNYGKGYQPTEFTLAKFSPDKTVRSPDGQGRLRAISMSTQRSTKPTFSNQDATPDFGRDSSTVANRRWFDQPLGDQNLRPVKDGQYGLIAGTSTDSYQTKSELAEANLNNNNNIRSNASVNT